MFGGLFIAVALASVLSVDGALDIVIKKYTMCEEYKDLPIKHHANFTKVNSTVTLADGDASVPFPVDDTVMINFKLESLHGDTWEVVHTLEKRNPCALLDKYGGGLWHDIQEAVKVEHGTCPLPKGEFSVKNHVVDFSKLPIKVAPKSQLRATAKALRGEEVIFCMYSEFDIV